MATRFNKDPQVNVNSGEQRTEEAAKRGKPVKSADASFKQVDHSGRKKSKLDDKGFKDVA